MMNVPLGLELENNKDGFFELFFGLEWLAV
jgi:hypothetical protein